MGKYSDMAAERAKARPAEEAAAKARRAESRAAYESSGAAKQIARQRSAPSATAAPATSPGSLSGDAKAALEADLGITQPRPFDRAVQGRSFGLRK